MNSKTFPNDLVFSTYLKNKIRVEPKAPVNECNNIILNCA